MLSLETIKHIISASNGLITKSEISSLLTGKYNTFYKDNKLNIIFT